MDDDQQTSQGRLEKTVVSLFFYFTIVLRTMLFDVAGLKSFGLVQLQSIETKDVFGLTFAP